MKKLILLLAVVVLVTSCKNSTDSNKEGEEEQARDLSYLALGDSYTIGESVEPEMRWPVQLVDSLRDREINVNYPVIIAKTGWTTGDLLGTMDQKLDQEKFDLVSVLIGVNNQYQGKSIEAYEADLHEIFQQAIEHSRRGKEGVFVVSIPDYGATPYGEPKAEEIGREIEEFNAVFRRVAKEYELDFYDITPISKKGIEEPGLVASDGLHPSGDMYSLWVEEFVDKVMAKVSAGI